MLTSSPGENRKIEGSTIMLSMKLEEQKGEPEKETFRIVKFQKKKGKTDVVLNVELYNITYNTFFKATFDDPRKVVADQKLPMGIIVCTLEEILTGRADKVVLQYDNKDGKEDLFIMTTINSTIFNRSVTFKFCYRFQMAKMSFEERIDMRLGIIEQKVNNQDIEKGELRLEAVEQKIWIMDNRLLWFIPGKPVRDSRFDISHNNKYQLTDDGTTVTHTGSTSWNTTTLNTWMKVTQAHRAHFRFASLKPNAECRTMFGVVSSSFGNFASCPQNGTYAWVAFFFKHKLHTSYQHNGSFQNAGGPSAFAGSIFTVEFYPAQGRIQYFVNSIPAGQHIGCSFNNGDCRFSVTTHVQGTKIKLISVEQIQDVF